MRSLFKKISLSLVFIFLVHSAQGNNSVIPHDFEVWTPFYFQNIPVEKNLKGYLEVQPRFSFDPAKTDILLIRPALYLNLQNGWSTWAGYAAVPNYYPTYVLEQRGWQQLQNVHLFGNITVINRFRFEQRYFNNLSGTGFRYRYQVRTLIPIDAQKKWSLAFYNEIFVNGNTVTGGPVAGLDQDRIFAGINHKLTPNVAIEAGYLYQTINLPNSEVFPVNHTLCCSTYVTF